MGPTPFAFSVSHFISSVGADAGFASIIGLAILILLYFAQARETAALREQAQQAAERVQQLERRVAQSHPGPAAAPATAAPATATQAGTQGGAHGAQAALSPAGVGAPGLTMATRQVPHGHGQPGAALGAGALAERPIESTSVAGPPPATVAGGANGARRTSSHGSVPLADSSQGQSRSGAASAGAGRQGRPTEPARPTEPPVPLAPAERPARSLARRAVIPALVVITAAATIGALLVLTSTGSRTSTPASSTSASASNAPVAPARRGAARRAPAPASITVAVLNGTATGGLAHRVAVKLGAGGFKGATVATATDQTRTATTVGYLAGHRRDALVVASALKLLPASVAPVDPSSQAVACPPPGACNAGVVVTVGSDLANRP